MGKKVMVGILALCALCFLLPATAHAEERGAVIQVGSGQAYETIASALSQEGLSGDVVVQLVSDVVDEGGISIPEKVSSLTIQADTEGTPRQVKLATVNPYNQTHTYSIQRGNSICCNGKNLSVSRDITLFSGGSYANGYPLIIFGGGFQEDAAGDPVVRFDGNFCGGQGNRNARLYLYGGGYNSNLAGNPTIVLGGSASFVTGGGLAIDGTANVEGTVSIMVQNGGSIANGLTGGGEADRESETLETSATAHVTGDISITCESGSNINSLTGGGNAKVSCSKTSVATLVSTAYVGGNVNITFAGKLIGTYSNLSMNCGGKATGTVEQPCVVEANVAGVCRADISGEMHGTIIGGGYAIGMDSFYYDPGNDTPLNKLENNRIHAGAGSVDLTVHEITNDWYTKICGGYAEDLYADFSVDGNVRIGVDNGGSKIDTAHATYLCGGIVNTDYEEDTAKAWNDTEPSVIGGDVSLDIKNISQEDTLYLYGGFFTDHAGKGTVNGTVTTKAEHCKIQTLCGAGYIGYGYSGSGNRFMAGSGSVKVKGNVETELRSCTTGTSEQYMVGCAMKNNADLAVEGDVKLKAVNSTISGYLYMAGYYATAEQDSTLTLLGTATIQGVNYWSDRDNRTVDTVTGRAAILVGDSTMETNIRVSGYLYRPAIDMVSIQEKATLTGSANQTLLYNIGNLHIEKTGSLVLGASQKISGGMEGKGTVVLPVSATIDIWGDFSGDIVLEMDRPSSGQVLAWSQSGTTGTFIYHGGDYSLVRTDAGEWYQWILMEARAVSASAVSLEGDSEAHGSVSPASQSVAPGGDAVIAIQRDPGYKVAKIEVNGMEAAFDGPTAKAFAISDVTEDTQVRVFFTEMTAEDVKEATNELPEIQEGQKPTPEEAQTILDTKLDYEALSDEQKEMVPKEKTDQLHGALSKLPNVEVEVEVLGESSGIVSEEQKPVLLENMTKSEAAALKAGTDTDYKIVVTVEAKEPGEDEKKSIEYVLDGAQQAGHHDVTVKKIITSSAALDSPREVLLPQVKQPLQLVFEIPEELRNAPGGVNRRFSILRTHRDQDGSYSTQRLEDRDSDPATCTVVSDRFSLYTLIYTDAKGGGTSSETDAFPFRDVTEKDWFYPAVAYVWEYGLMEGTSPTRFDPKLTTTRGMIVTILYRLEGLPEADSSSFSDVNEGAYYAEAVGWASSNGIVLGHGDGTFGPKDAVTREQLAAVLYRYAKYKGWDVSGSAGLEGFTDSEKASGYAKEALGWAVDAGILQGYGNGLLNPQGSATRAEVAQMLRRFCEIYQAK